MANIIRTASIATALVFGLTGCTPSVSPTPTPSSDSVTVPIYWAISNPTAIRLIEEDVPVPASHSDAVDIVSGLVSGAITPIDPDYVNLWGNGSIVNSVTVTNNVATVDLTLQPLNVGGEGEAIAIAQVVWTLTEADPAVTGVRFTVNGQPAESLAGHVDTTGVFKRDTLETDPTAGSTVLTSVSISGFTDRTTVSNPVTFAGMACTFEANVQWELFHDGVSVTLGNTTAKEACPNRSKWSVTLDKLAKGNYTFVVRDISAKDGSIVSEDSKDFTVN